MTKYDLVKTTAMRVKEMDKKYLSAVELMGAGGDVAVTGQFTGEVELVDLRSAKVEVAMKVRQFVVFSRIWIWLRGSS